MSPTRAFAVPWQCNVLQVLEFIGTNARIGVQCRNPITVNNGGTMQTISWLSVSATSVAATRMMTLANSALLTNNWLIVDVPTSSTTNNAGCLASDCRTPTMYSVWTQN